MPNFCNQNDRENDRTLKWSRTYFSKNTSFKKKHFWFVLTAPTRKVHLLKLKVTSEKVLQECCRICLWVDSPLTAPTNGKSTYEWKIRDQSCKSSWILHVLADFYRFMKDIAFTNGLKSGYFLCISLKPLPNFCNQNDRENDHTLKWSLAQKRRQKSWKPWLWSIILVCRYCSVIVQLVTWKLLFRA